MLTKFLFIEHSRKQNKTNEKQQSTIDTDDQSNITIYYCCMCINVCKIYAYYLQKNDSDFFSGISTGKQASTYWHRLFSDQYHHPSAQSYLLHACTIDLIQLL